jgi:hypothetical protein
MKYFPSEWQPVGAKAPTHMRIDAGPILDKNYSALDIQAA